MAMLPASQRYYLACLLTLTLSCAQAHSRRERRDREEIESEPAPIETEATPVERDPSEPAPLVPGETTAVDAADLPAADPSQTPEHDAGRAPPPEPDLALQIFDPEQVYLLGSANGDICETVVAPVEDPGRMIVGFACTSLGIVQIRPSDGRLLYSAHPGGLRVFSCDGCVPHMSDARYPSEPESNDPVIPSPCEDRAAEFPEFRVLPDGGVLHRCGEDWRDQAAKVVASSERFTLGFGHANTALREDGVFDLSAQQLRPFVGLPEGWRGPSRVRADGYWMVLGERSAEELWHVAFDGTARRIGAYSAPPETQQLLSGAKLDGQGRLYQIARETASARSTVVRRSVDAASEIIYAEPAGSRRWGYLFFMFTGP